MTIHRRSFLKGAAAAAAAALPAFFSRASFAAPAGDRIVVLVQLDGGNDGLNCVVPHGDDAYYRARPGIGIGKQQVARIDEYLGLHPNLTGLKQALDDDALAILQGIGYQNPNRSHFASSDIWQTGSKNPERWNGWVGRALDRCAAAGDVPGLYLDPGPLSLALVGEQVVVPSIADARRFKVQGRHRGLIAGLAERERDGATLEFIRRSAEQSYKTAARVERALANNKGRDHYPQTDLGRRLWQIARMIEANMSARVYAVRLTGFDTHARQRAAHDALMRILGDALGAFRKDLKQHRLDDRVLTMTYSEFGRRVDENRSLGTDHGAAAPLFVMGGKVEAGVHGKHPSLTDLGDGDLKFHTDFRQVYATVLERWLGVPSEAVLAERYTPVPFL